MAVRDGSRADQNQEDVKTGGLLNEDRIKLIEVSNAA